MQVRILDRAGAEAWLTARLSLPAVGQPRIDKAHAKALRKSVAGILLGIEFDLPVYSRTLEVGEALIQYRDRPSAGFPSGSLGGQWFALASLPPEDWASLAISHGHAGRLRYSFQVVRPVEALESSAAVKNLARPLYTRDRGLGGATQIFIPDGGLSSLA
jgi:hypothetical protein